MLGLLGLMPMVSAAQPVAPAALPPHLLNHNLLPPSPEAAALGRYGETPVSLYTGVPSISIPLFTMPGRNVSVPLSLQYHGGGVRPDQVAPWTGMGWTLNAGGAIVRTCRGIDDFDAFGYPTHSAPLPIHIGAECYNNATDGTGQDPLNYYEYLKAVFEGRQDTQPDLFSFNFMGYSGKIIFDQFGTPHVTPSQPLKIVSPLTSATGGWELTTPDGTRYTFTASEITNLGNDGESSGSKSGASSWFLTRITTAQHEIVDFFYHDYTTHINYLYTDSNHPLGVPALSSQTVIDGGKHPLLCDECRPNEQTANRPTTHIRGKYLRRIVSATHRVDLISSSNRPDQPGMRRLEAVRFNSLLDSARYQEVRFQYGDYAAPADRLFLYQVQRLGMETDGRQTTEPPYRLSYVPPYHTVIDFAGPARGTHAIDRWGYYNAAPNQFPFPRDNHQNRQVMAAVSRETNPATVTFGLLKQIQYPTGGTTTLEFESHDFSNANELSYTETQLQRTACVATAGATDCGSQTETIDFELTHQQEVSFRSVILPNDDNGPATELDGYGDLFDATGKLIDRIPYLAGQASGAETRRISLAPGRYRLQVIASLERSLQVHITASYAHRQYTGRKWRGGGTRIKSISTYDGLDHRRDQVKHYYYDTDDHTVSTGKLIHQPIFHSTFRYNTLPQVGSSGTGCSFLLQNGGIGGQYTCHYVVHFAEDIEAGNGSAQGSAVGYDTVSVVQRSAEQTTRTTSVFYNLAAQQIDLSDQGNINQGFISTDYHEQNGQELLTLDYVVRDGGDPFRAADIRLVRRLTKEYGLDSIPNKKIPGLSIGGSLGEIPQTYYLPCRGAVLQGYFTTVGWWPLTRTEETRYEEGSRPFTTTTRLLYRSSAHYQPYSQETTISGNQTRSTRYKYAADYASTADPGIRQLQERFMVTTPIETQQWLQKPDQAASWLSGLLTKFFMTSDGLVVPQRVYQTNIAAPLPGPVEPRSPAGYTALFPATGT
ncbi:hypothetical protein [Hymenobacter sp. ISL-91]|uniref:hypothetical protein n=1 Tax=Hymenobacter sp. ISL-91 TaxID=2819151 RepID=UPI001BEBB6E6|nr:hypothetical protein [Hymenobacter sp. ISL-91]